MGGLWVDEVKFREEHHYAYRKNINFGYKMEGHWIDIALEVIKDIILKFSKHCIETRIMQI